MFSNVCASPVLFFCALPYRLCPAVEGKKIIELRRLGKRICFGLEGDLWLVLHLMIAGRLHWYDERGKAAKGRSVAVFEFNNGSLTLTEAGTQKRASLHVVQGEAGLENLNPGGLEVFEATTEEFGQSDSREEPHVETRAYRSSHSEWNRQCLLG